MRKHTVISAMAVLTLLLLAQVHAQQPVVTGQFRGKPVVHRTGGPTFRNTINPDDPAMNGPVPRMPDGHPDLTEIGRASCRERV